MGGGTGTGTQVPSSVATAGSPAPARPARPRAAPAGRTCAAPGGQPALDLPPGGLPLGGPGPAQRGGGPRRERRPVAAVAHGDRAQRGDVEHEQDQRQGHQTGRDGPAAAPSDMSRVAASRAASTRPRRRARRPRAAAAGAGGGSRVRGGRSGVRDGGSGVRDGGSRARRREPAAGRSGPGRGRSATRSGWARRTAARRAPPPVEHAQGPGSAGRHRAKHPARHAAGSTAAADRQPTRRRSPRRRGSPAARDVTVGEHARRITHRQARVCAPVRRYACDGRERSASRSALTVRHLVNNPPGTSSTVSAKLAWSRHAPSMWR